jgi:molecular chaperone HscB
MPNHFELLQLPVSFQPDLNSLNRNFLKLSRQFHPDYFANASSEEQQQALEQSAQLNQALQVLKNPSSTIKYILQLKGLLQEDEKYQLSPTFLMEVMDLNEELMEWEMEPDEAAGNKLKQTLKTLEDEIYREVAPILEHYQETPDSEKKLLQVKEYYYRKKYLDRMARALK